jgi:hypothetical protein
MRAADGNSGALDVTVFQGFFCDGLALDPRDRTLWQWVLWSRQPPAAVGVSRC